LAAGQGQIGEIARTSGFRGSQQHKIAEPAPISTLPVVDLSDPRGGNVHTSIDCYVSGQYVGKRGQIHEVQQRYTVFVSYGRDGQSDAMRQTRSVIASDFSKRFGGTFNMTTVFVPELRVPQGREADPELMYGGSRTFAGRFDRSRYELEGEKIKYGENYKNIRRRYGLKR